MIPITINKEDIKVIIKEALDKRTDWANIEVGKKKLYSSYLDELKYNLLIRSGIK